MDDATYIRIKLKTKDRLDTMGSVKDTYDDVVKMLIDFYEKKNKK